LGRKLIEASLWGFKSASIPRAYLEVTTQNRTAVRIYDRLGFRRTKTLYKAVDLAYS
jgi:ribosomal protein S18 acetylase RimI-like enzyme